MRRIDLTGQKFGRLTALYRLHNTKGKTKWLCICDCGDLAEVRLNSLQQGAIKSCGCYRKETTKKLGKSCKKHGLTGSRLYHIWRCMKIRCYNKNAPYYKNYGGRGITICDEWRNDFKVFYNWAINNGYQENLTIDRIDVNGNYEPNNCRFISTKEQCNNKRSNVYLTFNGKTQTISQWSDELGIDYKSLQYRKSIDYFFIRDALNRNMTLKDVATKYHIPLDKIFDEYESRRKMYNYCEIINVMEEVYYNVR